jgi:endonuclease YncB( thermonuclease family)
MSELVYNKEVELKTSKPSKYGYYLGELFINGSSVNQQMIDLGLAKPYFGGTK